MEATCTYEAGQKTEKMIEKLLCAGATMDCWMGLCDLCPIQDCLLSGLEDDGEISFYQWVSTDRTDLLKISEATTDFCDRVRRYIPKISLHCYINRKQHEYFENLKTSLLTEKSIIANVDFGQNFTFLIQDAVQSYHWSPPQATIHPHALQFLRADDNIIGEVTYVAISDCLEHSARTFYCFHHEVMIEMKKLVDGLEKVYLVSDGSAAQYKGYKNFCNLLFHEKHYMVKAEHHLNVTAHGKSSCDAASGICKHNARQASKRGEKITTPFELFEFCQRKLESHKLKFIYVSNERVEAITKEMGLNERYQKAKPIPGSRSAHAFIPSNEWPKMIVKDFSSAQKSKEHSIFEYENTPERITPEEGQFVAFLQDAMRVGRVVKTDKESGDIKIIPMINASGKGTNTFRIKEFSVEMWIDNSAILCIVQPPVPTSSSGRLLKLQEDDLKKVCNLIKERK